MAEVAALAATAAAVLDSVAITATRWRIRSAANSGSLSSLPWAQRNSIATCRDSRGRLCRRPSAQTFRGDVEQWNDEDPEYRRSDHAAEHRRAHRTARQRPGSACKDQGYQAENEG